MGTISRLHRLTAETYLSALGVYDRWATRGATAPRDFSRVCVVAPAQKKNGIVIGAKLQVEALRRAGVDAELLDATPALRNPRFRISHNPASAYVFHSGGPQLAGMLAAVLPHAAKAWRVAYWAWELPTPPRSWPDPKGLVSEIWTPSGYARASLAKKFNLPIYVVPHVVMPAQARWHPKEGGRFTVLTLADSRSSFERKNLAGALRAFVRAFGDSPSARLIMKLNGPTGIDAALRKEASRYRNVEIVDRFLDHNELQAMFCSADVLLSLHRAEGFGLPMLEAMAMGLPVIATAWSGNLEFMDAENSILIPAKEVPVQDDSVYYRYENTVWADPDLEAAAAALRDLKTDRTRQLKLSGAAFKAAREFAATSNMFPEGVSRKRFFPDYLAANEQSDASVLPTAPNRKTVMVGRKPQISSFKG